MNDSCEMPLGPMDEDSRVLHCIREGVWSYGDLVAVQ
jgi:hypothetical protein